MIVKNNKKIIFFDGDGTIWYPKKTKRKIAPHWIYSDKKINGNCLKHLTLIPLVVKTLKGLKKKGIYLVLLSTHPHEPKEAQSLLKNKMKYFKLDKLFHQFYATKGHQESKGEFILQILKEKNIPKSKALMVGDSYRYDYLSARKVGIEAILIKTVYMRHPSRGKKIKNIISELHDLFKILK